MTFVGTLNRVILGLLLLVPGLFKLISVTPANFASAFAFLPSPIFVSWVWILAEVIIGLMVLFSIMPRFSSVIAALMMLLIVGFTQVQWMNLAGMNGGNWASTLVYLAAATNYLLFGRGVVIKRRRRARRLEELRKEKAKKEETNKKE